MSSKLVRKPQFNFLMLIAFCSFAAIVIGAAFQMELRSNPLSVLVCFIVISIGTLGATLLAVSALFSVSMFLTDENHHGDSVNIKRCLVMALFGLGMLSPAMLFTVMFKLQSLMQ